MKIFDLHADIGYDVIQKRKVGMQNILRDKHVPLWKKGKLSVIGMASYFEGSQSWEDMCTMITALKEEILKCDDIKLITKQKDLQKEGIQAVLTVEGMCGVQDDVIKKIDWLYEQGVRIASLTWNEENALATGAKGNPERGLTNLGVLAVQRMKQLHMLIDVSHANEKTFWDILKHGSGNVIATHSNAYSLCPHVRNLSDDQIRAIAKQKGIIGIVSAPGFVHIQKEHQDLKHLVAHMKYIKELTSIDTVAIGFDFMDFFEGYEDVCTKNLRNASYAQNLIHEMRVQGFNEYEIHKIAYDNAYQKLKDILKKEE